MNSREKGASAERELARLIHDHLGVRVVRNLEQSRRGGHDLIPDPEESGPVVSWLARYAIEVKRHAKVSPHLLKGWWGQTCVQAERVGLLPCLCYRLDRADWRVVLPLVAVWEDLPRADGVDWTVELSVPGFAALVREELSASARVG
jgi:Holliday junction resolvase